MPKGFYFLILAQFASGLADNALMILGVYFLQEQGYPGWWAPLLKFSFTLSYVCLASAVGPIADAFRKSHVMVVMNLVKLLGVWLLVAGAHPLLAFGLTGMAAAIYAPAKYGLVSESVPTALLVRANAWLEVSVLLSVMLGVTLGGALLQAQTLWAEVWATAQVAVQSWGVTSPIGPALLGVCGIYALSSLLNLGLAPLRAVRQHRWSWKDMRWSSFWQQQRLLWADPLGGMSLHVTTLCWGVGAVLQFAVLLWAQNQAGLTLQQGAYLQAVVALGVIGGAAMAACTCQIHQARRALAWGWVMAALLPCMALTHSVWWALPMLLLAGWAGGMLLVPMNALLQHRGLKIMKPGRSIAVQGFNENLSVLVMLGLYSAGLAWGLPLLVIMVCLSMLLMAAVWPWRRRRLSKVLTC